MKKTPLKKKPLKAKGFKPRTGLKKNRINIKPKIKKPIRIKSDSPIGRLIQKTDQVHSMLVRISAADKNGIVKCFTCNFKAFWKGSGIECGHFKSRSNMGTRYSLLGNKPQCNHCNGALNGNLKVFEENLIKEHGKDAIEYHKKLAEKVVPLTIEDVRNIKAELSFTLKNLRQEKGL
jgi:hypothetical protein